MPAKGTTINPDSSHLDEPNFKRFESLIERFLFTHPGVFKFTPSKLTPRSSAARFRDAVNAALVKGYQTTLDIPHLREVWPTVQVTVNGDDVLVGSRQVNVEALQEKVVDRPQGTRAFSLTNPSTRTLYAVEVLIHEGHLPEPVQISGLLPTDYRPAGDIVIEQTSPSTWVMA